MVGPGESKQVTLSVPAEELSYWSASLRRQVLEPGTFDVWVGFDATASDHATFEVTAGQ